MHSNDGRGPADGHRRAAMAVRAGSVLLGVVLALSVLGLDVVPSPSQPSPRHRSTPTQDVAPDARRATGADTSLPAPSAVPRSGAVPAAPGWRWGPSGPPPAAPEAPRDTLLPDATGGPWGRTPSLLGSPAAAGDPGAAAPQPPAETATPLAPVYRSSTTHFGTSLSGSDGSIAQALAANDRLFGRLPVVRQFDPGIPPDGAWGRRGVLHDRMVVTSFRLPPSEILSGRHDRALSAYFAEAPTARPIFWSYFHEPEPHVDRGEFTHREYREAWRHVVALAAGAGKQNLYPTLVLTGWTADPRSGRHWRDFHPGDSYVSVLAWDPYNSATSRPTTYRSPSELFAHVRRASTEFGKAWGIAETGSQLVAGDPGPGRAAWLAQVGRWASREGAAFVTYFQSVRDGDFKLTDQPSVDAWAALVRGSGGGQ